MAKMWKVEGIDPGESFAWNARRIVPVRVAEAYTHAATLADPHDIEGHHNFRISIKRLRYSLEFFAVCFDAATVASILSSLSTLQDLLGDEHDAEVFIPEFQRTLGELDERQARSMRRLVSRGRTARKQPMSFERYAAEFEKGTEFRAKPGILAAINRLREQRRRCYTEASSLWAALQEAGFRERLDGLSATGDEPLPS